MLALPQLRPKKAARWSEAGDSMPIPSEAVCPTLPSPAPKGLLRCEIRNVAWRPGVVLAGCGLAVAYGPHPPFGHPLPHAGEGIAERGSCWGERKLPREGIARRRNRWARELPGEGAPGEGAAGGRGSCQEREPREGAARRGSFQERELPGEGAARRGSFQEREQPGEGASRRGSFQERELPGGGAATRGNGHERNRRGEGTAGV
ncbi:hypothetical protein FHR53_004113 [Xanthomonas arboricola]